MEKRKPLILRAFALMLSLVLASCNMPTPASTPVGAASPTPKVQTSSTPIPPVTVTFTPVGTSTTPLGITGTPVLATGTTTLTPAADCDRVQFILDSNYPDGTDVKAGTTITKSWRVKNVGSCPWDSTYRLVYVRGEQMDGTSPAEIITTPVAPGSMTDISVELTVPEMNGAHWGVWQILNGAGVPLKRADGTPQELSILIDVTDGEGGRVTSVRTWSYTYVGVKCTNNVQYDIIANIYVDGPVAVGYSWSATGGLLTVVSQNQVFGAAGNVAVTTHINPPFADPNNLRVTLTANGVSSSYTLCP